MMEIFAVVVSALIVGGAAKMIADDRPRKTGDRLPDGVPVWTGSLGGIIVAHGGWHIEDVPEECKGEGNRESFASVIDYPFPGAYYTDNLRFRYVLPFTRSKGYVFHFGEEHPIEPEAKRLYILREVIQHIERTCAPQVKAIREEEIAHENRKRELAAFTSRFKLLVEADASRAIAIIKSGGQAKLKDWLNDPKLKMLPDVRATLSSLIANAERDLEWARQHEQSERERAVREAEQKVTAERLLRLEGPIALTSVPAAVVFGTRVKTGEDWVVPVRQLRHMLVAGVSGSGKSVLLHALCQQFVQLPEIGRLVLVDLKGGIEFDRYRDSGKTEVVWEFGDVCHLIDDLMRLMVERQEVMRQNRWQNWPQRDRVVLVIDEYAELQTEIDTASDKEAKASAKRLEANMVSLSRRARALGITLVCALQKATTDSMASSLRNNLELRLVLRQSNALTASGLLDKSGAEMNELPVYPTSLPTGRYYFYDAGGGGLKLLQAQIAAGVVLD